MTRPLVEVADILRVQGDCFREQNHSWLGYQQLSVLRAITACRTAALGGHLDSCSRCDLRAISYNSCRNRHCPKCQAQARQRWLARREQDLLPVPYFHVVFTLPHALNPMCQRHPRLLYDLLFRASAQTMLEVAADPKHLGAKIGFLSILHTWGQNLRLHPHLHCVIPAGGFDPSYSRWVHPKYPFFLPVKVLSRVFRGKYLALLQQALRQRRLDYPATLVRMVLKDDWVVYAKPAFGEPTRVLRYLGRYTHRVAISNQRLLSFDGSCVRFRWKDCAHGNKQRIMTLTAVEFLRRFCQHVLPRGFVRIRHFGYLASAHRTSLLALAGQQLDCQPLPSSHLTNSPLAIWRCPRCGAYEHRAQPHRATTGVSMQADRLLLMPAPSKGSRRCDRTSRPTCVFSAKLRPNNQFLPARSSRNHSSLRDLSPLPPYPARVFQPLCPIHRSQFSPLAP